MAQPMDSFSRMVQINYIDPHFVYVILTKDEKFTMGSYQNSAKILKYLHFMGTYLRVYDPDENNSILSKDELTDTAVSLVPWNFHSGLCKFDYERGSWTKQNERKSISQP